jgi:hypothetical protein
MNEELHLHGFVWMAFVIGIDHTDHRDPTVRALGDHEWRRSQAHAWHLYRRKCSA